MGFPLGQPLRIPVTVEDTTPGSPTFGTQQDPGALELLLGPPDAPVQTYTYSGGQLVRDAQGDYHYDITPQASGRWSWRWIATGAFAGATLQQWFTVESSNIG